MAGKMVGKMAFSGGGLERAAAERGQALALQKEPGARVLTLWRGRPLVRGDQGRETLLMLTPDHALMIHAKPDLVYLGRADGAPIFAADVSGWQPESDVAGDVGPGRTGADQPAPALPTLPEDARFCDLRAMISRLGALEAEIAATARGIFEWHRTHGFCATCGAPSEPADGGWRRDCTRCERPHFPRTDPVVIMLVTRGNSLLVGRSPGWPEGFFSLLAGFMEPGETVGSAVRREVFEETGVVAGDVRIVASQPWPFPASLMLGCTTEAVSTEITLDPAEIEEAFWISREALLEAFAGRHPRMNAPRKGAIAQFLMQMWLADRLD